MILLGLKKEETKEFNIYHFLHGNFITQDYTEALQQQTEASIVGLFQSQYLKTLLWAF